MGRKARPRPAGTGRRAAKRRTFKSPKLRFALLNGVPENAQRKRSAFATSKTSRQVMLAKPTAGLPAPIILVVRFHKNIYLRF